MTKREKQDFDSMLLRILHDTRKQLYPLKNSKSGVNYVMIPLTDILREINTFRTTHLNKRMDQV